MSSASTTSNFELLLTFLRGESRIPDAIQWSMSIRRKTKAIGMLYKDVLNQIPECFRELAEIKERGFGYDIESLKLALRYEVFLNSIYSLCENLSRIVFQLYREKNLPRDFHDQKSRFLEQEIDPEYASILKNTNWYDEVRSMRAEATHFLSGFIVFPSSTELGYLNVPQSEKKNTPENISIGDIEKHVKKLYGDVNAFLFAFGNHFIKIINQDTPIPLVCLASSGLLGAKSISLREFLNKESGVCITPNFNCPEKDTCQARIKHKE